MQLSAIVMIYRPSSVAQMYKDKTAYVYADEFSLLPGISGWY